MYNITINYNLKTTLQTVCSKPKHTDNSTRARTSGSAPATPKAAESLPPANNFRC